MASMAATHAPAPTLAHGTEPRSRASTAVESARGASGCAMGGERELPGRTAATAEVARDGGQGPGRIRGRGG